MRVRENTRQLRQQQRRHTRLGAVVLIFTAVYLLALCATETDGQVLAVAYAAGVVTGVFVSRHIDRSRHAPAREGSTR